MGRQVRPSKKGGDKVRYRTKYTLRQWRKVNDMTLKEASERIGVTEQSIIAWEQGRSEPRASTIRAIEKAYNIKWSDDVLMP